MDEQRFISLLGKMVAEVKDSLMASNPNRQEVAAARHVVEVLADVDHVSIKTREYAPGRTNLVLQFPNARPAARGPGAGDVKDDDKKPVVAAAAAAGAGPARTVAFVGAHLDVVDAKPEQWKRNPFELQVEDDKLYGRGTTDCLGHVALLVELFRWLSAKHGSSVSAGTYGGPTVYAVIICDEEIADYPQPPPAPGAPPKREVGMERLLEEGELECLRTTGPVYFLDCDDIQPTIGTGGFARWTLKATGLGAHSGMPGKGVNAIELGQDALRSLQDCFYRTFGEHKLEAVYGFPSRSSMKPTVTVGAGAITQIPAAFCISGDIRIVPFYRIQEVRRVLDAHLEELRRGGFRALEGQRGPSSRYAGVQGCAPTVDLEWGKMADGLACDLDGKGYRALAAATLKHAGVLLPKALTAGLPCVAEMQAAGFDVNCLGFGVGAVYHQVDEYASLDDFRVGFQVLCDLVALKKFYRAAKGFLVPYRRRQRDAIRRPSPGRPYPILTKRLTQRLSEQHRLHSALHRDATKKWCVVARSPSDGMSESRFNRAGGKL